MQEVGCRGSAASVRHARESCVWGKTLRPALAELNCPTAQLSNLSVFVCVKEWVHRGRCKDLRLNHNIASLIGAAELWLDLVCISWFDGHKSSFNI